MALENEKCKKYGLQHDGKNPCYFCRLDSLAKADLYEELLDFKRRVREFCNYLNRKEDEYAENKSSINIELSVVQEIMDDYNNIFLGLDF